MLNLLLRLLVCAGMAVGMYGQATTLGSIVGTVSDPSGASVPGARVRVTNAGTGVSREMGTNDAGY